MPIWEAYIDAARRKIDIAIFHGEQLKAALCAEQHDWRPSVPVQASFEGVVISVVSAIDQVAQAANSAWKLGAAPGELFEKASAVIETELPSFRAWRDQPIGLDLRRLRTRMVHYSYDKSAAGGRAWHVEETGSGYGDSRDVGSYSEAAIAYGHELAHLANELADVLRTKYRETEGR